MICCGMRLLPNSSLEVILKVGTLKRKNLLLVWVWPMTSEGFPDGKESPCNARDMGSILGLGRSPGEQKGYSLQYSGLENSMDCIVHGVPKSWTGLSNFHFHWHLISFSFVVPLLVCVCFPLKRQLGHLLALGEHSFKQKKELWTLKSHPVYENLRPNSSVCTQLNHEQEQEVELSKLNQTVLLQGNEN